MKNGSATMFMYSETFVGKGPNETISFLNYYFSEKIERSVKKNLHSVIIVSHK
jgi:hypothetical protein